MSDDATLLDAQVRESLIGDPEQEPPMVTKSGRVLTDDDVQALADEAEQGYDVSHLRSSLTGVVSPPEEESPFDQAARTVTEQLATVQLRIAELRAQRTAINAEVASLVAQEQALKRMARIVVRVEEADPA